MMTVFARCRVIIWKTVITTLKTMVELSQTKMSSLMEIIIMCDFVFSEAKEACYIYCISVFIYFVQYGLNQ